MRKSKKPLISRSGLVLDGQTIEELVRQIEDDDTEWGEPLPRNEWPGRGRGRPSLSGQSEHSPSVSFRLDPADRDRAAARAKREGKTMSQLARDALEQYLAS